LSITFTITVHKAQGITLEQAILDISGPEFTAGLNYVAISRVKSKEGLLFDTPFDYNTIRRKPGQTLAARLADWNRRTSQVIELLLL
jgi:ATP-dependent exoDNAse (exonuclease V) alpha subunit